MRKFFLVLTIAPLFTFAQQKQISLDDLYKRGTFRADPVSARFESQTPASSIDTKGLKDQTGTDLSRPDRVVTTDKNSGFALLSYNTESIYRRSSKAFLYLYNVNTKSVSKLSTDKALHPSFSPDGSKVAFIESNNLYIYDVVANKKTAVTTDGKWNFVINGNCDWVYEEEFGFSQAYQWSENGSYLAYYRFDESAVKEYNMTVYDDGHNADYRFKYPKAGDANSTVDIFVYDVKAGSKIKAQYQQGDIYIPRIKWTKNDSKLVVFWLNRHQNNLKLLLTDAATGTSQPIYEETNQYYVDINDDWQFLEDGKHFVYTSEREGYTQIYLNSFDGKVKTKITKDNFDVASINGVDEKNKRIYYTAAYPRPMDRNFFVADFAGKKVTPLTTGEFTHRVTLNKDFTQFYDFKSDINTPQVVTLNNIVTKKNNITVTEEKVVNSSEKLNSVIDQYATSKAEFLRIPNSKGDTLNSWILRPTKFDASKQYPVLFCNYGGPGSQNVANRFGSVSFWHQMLAERGFIIVCVDNTGTGFRGEAFKKKTYLQLGKYEIEDQIDAAKWLGQLPYVDKTKIGHWGWSYGGFMSSLAITKGADVFSAAIAVAPVTNWRYYDNIYTERYMRTPQENIDGYDKNSPINFTNMIKGKYLIIHGTGDDNVHFQNATQMITALVKNNVDFESAYYPNKNHGISGSADNTSYHLWSKMTNWLYKNLGNKNTTE